MVEPAPLPPCRPRSKACITVIRRFGHRGERRRYGVGIGELHARHFGPGLGRHQIAVTGQYVASQRFAQEGAAAGCDDNGTRRDSPGSPPCVLTPAAPPCSSARSSSAGLWSSILTPALFTSLRMRRIYSGPCKPRRNMPPSGSTGNEYPSRQGGSYSRRFDPAPDPSTRSRLSVRP